ncbi:MAG: transposase [Actinomycetota bacterium]|nr:transposase [Actinomycetota bacterium]
MSAEDRHTSLGEAFAHYGRIFKTLHVLQLLHDESYRRAINTQLNLTEARNAWPGASSSATSANSARSTSPAWRTSSAHSAWA